MTRFLCIAPDPVTGRMAPYRGEAGIAIEFSAADKADALRLARVNKIPAAVSIMTAEEYEALEPVPTRPGIHFASRPTVRLATQRDEAWWRRTGFGRRRPIAPAPPPDDCTGGRP